MAGYHLTAGEIRDRKISREDIQDYFDNIFSSGSRKDTTYKFALVYSLLKNLNRVDNELRLSYHDIFEYFTFVYWGLVWTHKLKQTKQKNKAAVIERVINECAVKNGLYQVYDFSKVPARIKHEVISEAKSKCKINVFGALYEDAGGCMYGFSNKDEILWFNRPAYEYMMENSSNLNRPNIHEWAEFLEKYNSIPNERVSEDMSVPERIDYYKQILKLYMDDI